MAIDFDDLTGDVLKGDNESLQKWCSIVLDKDINIEGFLASALSKINQVLENQEDKRRANALFLSAFLKQYKKSTREFDFIPLYDEAIQLRQPEAMLERAKYYECYETTEYRPEPKTKEAIVLYQEIIELSGVHNKTKSEAMIRLGSLYQTGATKVKKDDDKALHYLQEASKLGHPDAERRIQHNLRQVNRVTHKSDTDSNLDAKETKISEEISIDKIDNLAQEKQVEETINIIEMLTEKSPQESLIKKIKKATVNYLAWMETNAEGTRFLTRFSHFYHGGKGKERARKILKLIQSDSDPETILTEVKNAYNASGCRQHSYSRYIYDALMKDYTVDQLSDEDFLIIKKNNTVSNLLALTA